MNGIIGLQCKIFIGAITLETDINNFIIEKKIYAVTQSENGDAITITVWYVD